MDDLSSQEAEWLYKHIVFFFNVSWSLGRDYNFMSHNHNHHFYSSYKEEIWDQTFQLSSIPTIPQKQKKTKLYSKEEKIRIHLWLLIGKQGYTHHH